MKPLYLEFTGINSYRGRQQVDFTQLLEGGLFGIFGETGSGKSTILDAITLALYGVMDRMESNTLSASLINTQGDRASVHFTFQLGTLQYRVERAFVRGRTGSVRTAVCRLTCLNGLEALIDDTRGVNTRVVELLGLNSTDFRRAVVLPQGKFQEFLRLKGQDRTRMLQALFKLDRYGDALNDRIRGKKREITEFLAGLKEEELRLGDVSNEAIVVAHQALHGAAAQLEQAELLETQAQAHHSQTQQQWQGQQQLQRAREIQKAWVRRDAEAQGWRVQLDAARQAEPVWAAVQQLQRAQQQEAEAAQTLALAASQRAQILDALALVEQEYLNTEQQYADQHPLLLVEQTRLKAARPLEQDVEAAQAQLAVLLLAQDEEQGALHQLQQAHAAALSAWTAGEAELAQLKHEVNQRTIAAPWREQVRGALAVLQQVQPLRETCHAQGALAATSQTEWETAQGPLAHAQHTLAEFTTQLEETRRLHTLHLEQRPVDLAQLGREVQAWPVLESQVARVGRAAIQMQQVDTLRLARQTERDAQMVQLEGAQALLGAAEQEVQQAEQRHQQAWAQLSAAQAADLATHLAQALQEGQPCEVCGSVAHPQPARPRDAVAFAELTREAQAAAALLAHTREHLGHARAALDEVQGALRSLDTVVAAADLDRGPQAELSAARLALPEAWRLLDPGELETQLQVRGQESRARQERALVWSTEEQALAQREGTLERQQLEAQLQVAFLERNVEVAAQQAAGHQQEHLRLTQTLQALQERLDRLCADDSEAQILEHVTRIQRADQEWAQWSTRLDQQRLQQQQAQEREVALDREVATLQARLQTRTEQLEQRQDAFTVIRLRLREVVGDQTLDQRLQQVEADLQALEAEVRDVTGRRAQLLDQQAPLERDYLNAEQLWRGAQGGLTQAQEVCSARLRASPFEETESAERALLSEAAREALSAQLELHQAEGARSLGQLRELELQVTGPEVSVQELEEREAAWRQAQAQTVVRHQAQGQAQGHLDQLILNRQAFLSIEQRRRPHEHQGRLLAEIEELCRGKQYVTYLAEEQLGHLAALASEQLHRLTGGRYALQIEADGGNFVMADHLEQAQREVHTLSGGETFLTSLALALSLSKQIQLRSQHPLEFLFLDEGFGSLDPALTGKVMDLLESGQSGLNIGVISHVPLVQERVQRRILVENSRLSGQGSQLRLDFA